MAPHELGTFAPVPAVAAVGVPAVTGLGGMLVGTGFVATGVDVGKGLGVLAVVKHATSMPNANRAIANRTNVFIVFSVFLPLSTTVEDPAFFAGKKGGREVRSYTNSSLFFVSTSISTSTSCWLL